MAKNSGSPVVSDKVRRGCFPGAKIYCVEKSFCLLPAHIPLTARCNKADGAISNLCYGFNIEEDAPNFTFVHLGNDNSVNTSLHSFVYWIHGYQNLDSVMEGTNTVPMDVPGMCHQAAIDVDCDRECPVGYSRHDHDGLIDYLFSESVFNVRKEDFVLFVATTSYNLMHLYHGNMKVLPGTKKTVVFSDAVDVSGMCVDLYNGAMMLDCFDEGYDPLDIPANLKEGKEWVKSDVLSRLIHEAYVCSHAASFNMLDDINGCRRLLLSLGQASTFKQRKNKLKEYKYHDIVGNHKDSIAKDMVDRCSLATYLGVVESYSECSPTAHYKNWALKDSKDLSRLMAVCQKANMAPLLWQSFGCPNAVGVGFKSVLKSQQELNNEKAFVDRRTKDTDKEQKKLSKDLNQFKIQPGPSERLQIAQRINVAYGFSPHLSQFAYQTLGFLSESKRTGNEEAQYRSSTCNFCNGDKDGCFCRALPKNVAAASIMSGYGNWDNRISGVVLLSNNAQAFGDLEQPPFNMNASDEEITSNRKIKPVNLIGEALSKLPDDVNQTLDKIFDDPKGDTCSLVSRVESLHREIREKSDVVTNVGETRSKWGTEKDAIDYKQVIYALKVLYNVVHEQAMKYCNVADDVVRQKRSQQITHKHLFQTTSFLPSYAPYGPACVILASRTLAYFVYATLHTFICSEVFKNQAMQMSKLVENNELFNPNVESVAKVHMGKNQSLKLDLNVGAGENQTVLKVNEAGECAEMPCSHLQTANSMKPIALKKLLFNATMDEEKPYHKIGMSILGEDNSKLFSGVDTLDMFAFVNNDSTDLGVVMMAKNNIGDNAVIEGKDVLKEYLPIFKEHDSDNANSFFHKIFCHSQREIRIQVARSRGGQVGKRLQNLIESCIDSELLNSREQIICMAKYGWIFGRGKKTFSNGLLPINKIDLMNSILENLISCLVNVKNDGLPLESMNKILPLVVNPNIKKDLLTPFLTATLSSGYALQSCPLIMGTLSSFAFSSGLGTILRCGLSGLNTSLLNKMQKSNIDSCSGMADVTRNYVILMPNTNNFIRPRNDALEKGLRPDELQSVRNRLELCYTEEMTVNALLEFLNMCDFNSRGEAVSEMQNLLMQHCDLFDEVVVINNVLKHFKKLWPDEDNSKKMKLSFPEQSLD